jgi:hypothetical protein
MELFIQIKDGQPFEHPIFINNFCLAFPNVDVNNLPPQFARFKRVPCPSLVYATLNAPHPTYEWVEGVVQDVWDVVPMTAEEIESKQNTIKQIWAVNGFASWKFDEETCSYKPPVPRPADENIYYWSEEVRSWVQGEAPTNQSGSEPNVIG